MELSTSDIITLLTLVIGSGGAGGFISWKWSNKQAKADAVTAETQAVQQVQDVYQQLIEDIKTDRNEQKTYINELKDDRRHLREERDDLRNRQETLEQNMRQLQETVARNGRMVEAMRPFLCGKSRCAERVAVNIS